MTHTGRFDKVDNFELNWDIARTSDYRMY